LLNWLSFIRLVVHLSIRETFILDLHIVPLAVSYVRVRCGDPSRLGTYTAVEFLRCREDCPRAFCQKSRPLKNRNGILLDIIAANCTG
jgi:hypothetical protein